MINLRRLTFNVSQPCRDEIDLDLDLDEISRGICTVSAGPPDVESDGELLTEEPSEATNCHSSTTDYVSFDATHERPSDGTCPRVSSSTTGSVHRRDDCAGYLSLTASRDFPGESSPLAGTDIRHTSPDCSGNPLAINPNAGATAREGSPVSQPGMQPVY
ncbi:hypothetical protein N7478_010250 [Penicillium angulare]|uniref:uncharacterized protein n=1 Tax=Penicillium angulare TaxID=116970 RepID=UPI00253FB6B7|nr:uncharacterized protein N7478_010042 [Penicillium angulare]XP_056775834.1 uncharacterized protein N7478_010250 [Penicillium angulare]KAJ5267234.1 hypothetical protein N7478_010042 [Penicillium angulare]KAJ5267442.1 hypothetical protein N7478_010250 [Penicillium angulare]